VLLLLALIYVYAIIGVSMFAQVDPASFGSIPATFFTLFQVLTLESWNVLMIPVVKAFPVGGPLYFVSFIVLGAMLIMNLFLGVIITSMSKAVKDADELQERSNEEKILEKVSAMERRLDAIADRLKR
jgi:voltage-gated sodium channel